MSCAYTGKLKLECTKVELGNVTHAMCLEVIHADDNAGPYTAWKSSDVSACCLIVGSTAGSNHLESVEQRYEVAHR